MSEAEDSHYIGSMALPDPALGAEGRGAYTRTLNNGARDAAAFERSRLSFVCMVRRGNTGVDRAEPSRAEPPSRAPESGLRNVPLLAAIAVSFAVVSESRPRERTGTLLDTAEPP